MSYNPYATPGEFKSGLGLVDRRDGWWTGNERGHLPGTTVIQNQGGQMSLLGLVDPRDGWWTGNERGHLPGTTVIRYSGGQAQIMGALGYVTGEINRSLTGLGTIPNDDELSTAYGGCYTPVHSGWTYGKTPEGKQYYAAGLYGGGLGDASVLSQVPVNEDTAQELIKLQRRQLLLQGLSSLAIAAVAVSAVIGCFRKVR